MTEQEGHVPTESPRQRSARRAASRKTMHDDESYDIFDEHDVPRALQKWLVDAKLQDAVLRLGGTEVRLEALWQAVKQAGGYEEVSKVKGWSGIGRGLLGANPATDLSHRVKKSYEKMLLPFEKALERGDPLEAAVSARSHSFKGVKGLKIAGAKIDKGAKRKGKPKAEYSGAALVGQRIIVKWNVEGSEALYIGRVGSFKKGMHKVDFDDGDQAEYNLAGETWRVATLQDEAEAAQNNFVVAFPPAHGPALHSPRAPGLAVLSDASGSPADDEQHHNGASGALEDDHDEGTDMYGADMDSSVLVKQEDGYQVRKLEYEGTDMYEIHAQLPGISKEGVKVKCWPDGRVRIRGNPDPGAKTWVPAPIERNVQLPAPIDPHSARALLTLHGLLLVTAYAAEPPGAGPGPPGPAGAATAAGDAGDAPHAADGGLGNTGVVPEGDAMEGAA